MLPPPKRLHLTRNQKTIYERYVEQVRRIGVAYYIVPEILTMLVLLVDRLQKISAKESTSISDLIGLADEIRRWEVDLGLKERGRFGRPTGPVMDYELGGRNEHGT